MKCKDCDKVFTKNCELEVHVKKEHQAVHKLNVICVIKNVVLKWRLIKHHKSQLDEERKKCHYFSEKFESKEDDENCYMCEDLNSSKASTEKL